MPQVFLSYRWSASTAHAVHLEASLIKALAADSVLVFRDRTALAAGDKFPERIEKAIRSAAAVLVLIDPDWLSVCDDVSGKPRLQDPKDFVRREVELALAHGRCIVPVLVDGAAMPGAANLPSSIAELAAATAVTLPWHEGVEQIVRSVRAEVLRLELAFAVPVGGRTMSVAASSREVAIFAMQSAIHNRSGRKVLLSSSDLAATMKRLQDMDMQGAVLQPDLIYAIDMIGVKSARGALRYVARSRPVESLDELVACVKGGQMPLSAVYLTQQVIDTGFSDDTSSAHVGAVMGVVSGWHEGRREFTIQTFRSQITKAGELVMSFAAARKFLPVAELRLVEPAPLPLPASLAARRHLAASQALAKKRAPPARKQR